MTVKDTSKDYDAMIDYVSESNLATVDLSDFMDTEAEEKAEYKPEVRAKTKDPNFPEPWQKMYVNFSSFENYAEFMNKIDSKPAPKLSELVYERPDVRDLGVLSFIDGDEDE